MKLIFLSILVIFTITINAQTSCCPYVMPLQILPINPNPTDDILVAIDVTTPSLGNKIYITSQINGNQILIKGCYFSGMSTALQTYLDTINLGKLPANTYYIKFTAAQSNSPNECDSSSLQQTIFDTFIVSKPQPISNINKEFISVYPNPCFDNIYFKNAPSPKIQLEIVDLFGRKIETYITKENFISVKKLIPGFYILRNVESNQTILLEKK
jgi:hypothetical protein